MAAPTTTTTNLEHSPALHHASVGEEEPHHEKKPVLKKVKDKVKKIKNTITKKKHGHGVDEHQHEPNLDEDEDGYEDDEDEEMEANPDPEVHGTTSVHEATIPGSAASVQEQHHSPTYETLTAPTRPDQNRRPSTVRSDAGMLSSFQAMALSEKREREKKMKQEEERESYPPTGSHEQFSPPEKPTAGENDQSYTEKIASTAVAAKDKAATVAATVYEKVAETGAVLASKVQPQEEEGRAQDKGVSVKEYLVEKVKPGEEDRALSEVISEKMQKRNEEEVVGSEEGSGGKGMVEKVRETVTSLVGGGAPPAGGGGAAEGKRMEEEAPREMEGREEEKDL